MEEGPIMSGPGRRAVSMPLDDLAPGPQRTGRYWTLPRLGGRDTLTSEEDSDTEPEFTPPASPDPTPLGAAAGPEAIVPGNLASRERHEPVPVFERSARGVPVPALEGRRYTPGQARALEDFLAWAARWTDRTDRLYGPFEPAPGFGGYDHRRTFSDYHRHSPRGDDNYAPLPGPVPGSPVDDVGMGLADGHENRRMLAEHGQSIHDAYGYAYPGRVPEPTGYHYRRGDDNYVRPPGPVPGSHVDHVGMDLSDGHEHNRMLAEDNHSFHDAHGYAPPGRVAASTGYHFRRGDDNYVRPPGPVPGSHVDDVGMGSPDGHEHNRMLAEDNHSFHDAHGYAYPGRVPEPTGDYPPDGHHYYAPPRSLSDRDEFEETEPQDVRLVLEEVFEQRQKFAQCEAALAPLQSEINYLTADFQHVHFHYDEGMMAPEPALPEHVAQRLSEVQEEAAGIREQRARAQYEHERLKTELIWLVMRLSL